MYNNLAWDSPKKKIKIVVLSLFFLVTSDLNSNFLVLFAAGHRGWILCKKRTPPSKNIGSDGVGWMCEWLIIIKPGGLQLVFWPDFYQTLQIVIFFNRCCSMPSVLNIKFRHFIMNDNPLPLNKVKRLKLFD